MTAEFDPLRSWISPEHLRSDVLSSYRRSFEKHPGRLVILENILIQQVADKLSRFLRNEAKFETEYGLYSQKDSGVSEEKWLRAPEADRFFRFSKLVEVASEFRMSLNALTYLRFRKSFQDPAFQNFFECLCGLELAWGDDFGSHSMKAGDFLKAHDDNNRNRRIALVIYLSDDWEETFGGCFNMFDQEGRTQKIVPTYNSMVVFDVTASTTHFVDPIGAEAGTRARVTIGGWYHRPTH